MLTREKFKKLAWSGARPWHQTTPRLTAQLIVKRTARHLPVLPPKWVSIAVWKAQLVIRDVKVSLRRTKVIKLHTQL